MIIRRLVFLVIIAVSVTIFVRTYVIEGIYVASASMEPTLLPGRHLFLEKLSLKCRSPRRGDIVVFASPVNENRDLIKRIIAIPGDVVEIRGKTVFLNGEELREPYVQHTRKNEALEGDNMGPLNVPKGAVFVMGDNRDESGDSRDWIDQATGAHIYFVSVKTIKGKLINP